MSGLLNKHFVERRPSCALSAVVIWAEFALCGRCDLYFGRGAWVISAVILFHNHSFPEYILLLDISWINSCLTHCFVDFTKSDLKFREVKSPNIRSHCIDLPSPVYVIFNRKLIPGDKSDILWRILTGTPPFFVHKAIKRKHITLIKLSVYPIWDAEVTPDTSLNTLHIDFSVRLQSRRSNVTPKNLLRAFKW